MRLSTKGRYATRIMLEIAKHYGNSPVHLDEIEERQGISKNYVENLLRVLRKKGLVSSIKGPGGGYILTKEPSLITIGEIITSTEGPVELVKCISDKNFCSRIEGCIARLLWKRASGRISEVFNSITLDDLCFEEKRGIIKEERIGKQEAKEHIKRILEMINNMLIFLEKGFMDNSEEALNRARSIGRRIDIQSFDLGNLLEKSNLSSLILIPSYLERIGDSLESISYSIKTKIEKKIFFPKATVNEIKSLIEGMENSLKSLINYLENPQKTLLNTIKETKSLLSLIDKYRALQEKGLKPSPSLIYLDIMDSFKNAFEHTIRLSKCKGIRVLF
ncbi:MAG: RrF2 family transcriptional regulator [bacterium]